MALEDYNCVLCTHQFEEALEHLFLFCPFAEACWASIGIIIPQIDDITITDHFKAMLHLPFFMEIIVTMIWSIWEVRNDAIFRNMAPSIQSFKRIFRREFAWVIHILRAKANYKPFISQWLEVHV